MLGLNETTMEPSNKITQDTFYYRIPALVFLGLMTPLGIVGNASAIYVYGFRLKKSNVHLLITMLAVSDIISCLVCIPMEMYRVFVFYNYSSIAACKFEGGFLFACYICSVLMLLTISVERYVKVCRSTGTQVSRKMAKILAGAVFFVSFLLAAPMAVFAKPQTYMLHGGRSVHICSYHYEPEQWSCLVALFVFLLCVFGVMSALYWRVIKTTRSHVTWSQQRRTQFSADVINGRTQTPKSAAKKNILSKTNRTVIWISAVFAASCIPVFIVAGVSKFVTLLKAENSLDVLFFLVMQSWTLICTLNPVVYGILNSTFRAEIRGLLKLSLPRGNSSSVESNQTDPSESV